MLRLLFRLLLGAPEDSIPIDSKEQRVRRFRTVMRAGIVRKR